jgi:muramidase (phage lysozyme)
VQRESRGNYSAVNSSSGAGGAYQFLQSTWNNTVRNAGRTDLVGVHPSNASPADQDAMAAHLLQWQGRSPWAGGGC